MARMKKEKARVSPLKMLAGPEIETLADYLGQGALGVHYFIPSTDQVVFHPLKDAYNDIIAQPMDKANKLCMSTDSNRSEESNLFPKRTSIEFRSGPEPHNTEELLHLTKAYSDWLTQQKTLLRRSQFKDYHHPTRKESGIKHYLNLSDFITYYNDLKGTTTKLYLTLPHDIFDPKNSGPDFEFKFPEDARWVLQLSYADLDPEYNPVFTTQYNMSIPIGCVFDPQVKKTFPIATEFPLLDNEKEVAADFNESRPHLKLTEYEQQTFATAVELADQFFTTYKFPGNAIGAKDFLRGMAYEIAMISTSENYLVTLFQQDALWIAQQHKKARITKGGEGKPPTDKEVNEIAIDLANTLKKSIFPYFMKTTLANFFKQLHPYEQQLLKNIPKRNIKTFCQRAIKIANGGVGNTEEHAGHLMFKCDSFMELFDDFYQQTFQGIPVDPDCAPADPIGCLTDRFIPIANLGSKEDPVKAVVVELRNPAQGKQGYKDIQELCTTFSELHQATLNAFYPTRKECSASLDVLYSGNSKRIKTTTSSPSLTPDLPEQAVSALNKKALNRSTARRMFSVSQRPGNDQAMDSKPTRAASTKAKNTPRAPTIEQQKMKTLEDGPAKNTRKQLKRKAGEAELKSPLSTKSFFAKKGEPTVLKENHSKPKRTRNMNAFSSV
ncbi:MULTISPECIES: hypothetical protein [Legionella]|uniref:hypothetical protein n=1 Tax=Legionella TaxID=445 RepID=UPI00095C1552|nr:MULTISPECIES: hypothetical protein [Legionella]MBN9226190.1 hypothetical protein [Legionella steelei]OJW12473.1 MAG: hypothetical protein BGO44_10465 [Legionella sp. 39-23]